MFEIVDHARLHRTAKYFMDSGRSASHEAAVGLLRSFGLTVHVGAEVARSPHHQTALLTLVNVARRTFLGGVDVVGPCDTPSLCGLAPRRSLSAAVRELGGRIVQQAEPSWPAAVIGGAKPPVALAPFWQLTWHGWSGGVTPFREQHRLEEGQAVPIAPALAAAVCAAEVFAFHATDHPMAGRRAAGLSLWKPGEDWLGGTHGPELAYLPSQLWLIGMGNLGQAFAWLLACLPYRNRDKTALVLQDFDRIAPSNDSTSVLSFLKDVGRFKTRTVSTWLEERGFITNLEERRFGEHTCRARGEPGVALCGVDNALARMALEKSGFDLIVEAGLGGGPNAFRSISMHTFPGSRTAEEIWSRQVGQANMSVEDKPAYQALKSKGMDACGLAQLAARTVGVPFVGLIAGALVVGELLRRLHGSTGLELVSGSVSALEDFESVEGPATPYPGAFDAVARPALPNAEGKRDEIAHQGNCV